MPPLILLAGLALLLLAAGGVMAATNPPGTVNKYTGPFDAIYQKYGTQFGVDWRLIKAHAQVESSENQFAFNTEGSSGLMQILLPLSHNTGARRHFDAGRLPEWRDADAAAGTAIFDPDYNVSLAASLIRENIKAYGLPRAIAVYNMDKSRLGPLMGPFANQGYVDKVLTKARALGMQA